MFNIFRQVAYLVRDSERVHDKLNHILRKEHEMSAESDALKAQVATTVQLQTDAMAKIDTLIAGQVNPQDAIDIAQATADLAVSDDALKAKIA